MNFIKSNYFALPGIKPGLVYINAGSRKISDILILVQERFGITMAQMISKVRYKSIVEARHTAIYLIRKHTDYSLAEIGKLFGGRDHTTVISSVRRIEDIIATEPDFKNKVLMLENVLMY